MNFENTQVMNFSGALRGMRNPKESWHLSDSFFGIINYPKQMLDENYIELVANKWIVYNDKNISVEKYDSKLTSYISWLYANGILQKNNNAIEVAFIGPKDMKLAQILIAAGPEHRKFLRQIFVCVDITAPLYWWKEFDTYKIGTVANSTSTMHKLTAKPITIDCFEIDDRIDGEKQTDFFPEKTLIPYLENLRLKYIKTKDKQIWKELIRWLPESWLQTRTVTMNYENLLSMVHQRHNHRLNEWSGQDEKNNKYFLKWIESLPYAKDLILYNELIKLD